MDQIEIVQQYLKVETNYAIILNGKYGSGKTYFFNNELVPMISRTPILNDSIKKYKPIKISLFGTKTIEEINFSILEQVWKVLQSKGFKYISGLTKAGIRGYANIKGLRDIDKYIADITPKAGSLLKYDELFICFDDIDRKCDSLSLNEVFGFINTLVENKGVKILVIADARELAKDPEYAKHTEKVVGVKIEFIPNTYRITNQIIDQRFSGQKEYQTFLTSHLPLISKCIEDNECNFRNLNFFLSHFQTIYCKIEIGLREDSEINNLRNEYMEAVLEFTISISIEYKMGNLNASHLEEIRKLYIDDFTALVFNHSSVESQEKKEETLAERFRRKYFPNKNYHFFSSIFQFITGTKAFDVYELKKEIIDNFNLEKGSILPEYIVLKKLDYRTCYSLAEDEYIKLTKEMLAYVDKGKYKVGEYNKIFHFAIRFDNLLDLDSENLLVRFKKGISKRIASVDILCKSEFNDSVHKYHKLSVYEEQLRKYCSDIYDKNEVKKEQLVINKLFFEFENSFDSFLKKVIPFDNEFRCTPLFSKFDLDKVISIILSLDKEQLIHFSQLIANRYRADIPEELLIEKDTITALKNRLISHPDLKKKSMRGYCLQMVINCCSAAETNFNSRNTY